MAFYNHSTLVGWYLVSITNNKITVCKANKENGRFPLYRPILEETHTNNEKAFTRFQELLTLASEDKL